LNAWKVIVSTLVIFIAGVITGVVITATEGIVITRAIRRADGALKPVNNRPVNVGAVGNNMGAATPWQFRNKELLRRMDRELELTPEQHTRIEHIMDASAERTKAIWKPIAPLMNKETQLARAEIRAELTPEQQKKFEDFPRSRPGMDKRRNGTNSPTAGLATNLTATNLTSTNAVSN
jgi:hypothetical protein